MTDTARIWNGNRAQPRTVVLYSDSPRVEQVFSEAAVPQRVSQRVPVMVGTRRDLRCVWKKTESGLRCTWVLSDE